MRPGGITSLGRLRFHNMKSSRMGSTATINTSDILFTCASHVRVRFTTLETNVLLFQEFSSFFNGFGFECPACVQSVFGFMNGAYFVWTK